MHEFHVGEIAVTTLSDGHLDLPLAYFPQARADTPAGDPVDPDASLRVGANVWMVTAGKRRILVDAGSGTALLQRFPQTGRLAPLLADAGIAAGDITDIVLTYMHPDHVGGLVTDGGPAFPGAQIHVANAEWTFWTDPALAGRTPDARKPVVGLVQAIAGIIRPQVTRHEGTADLGEGICLLPAPGHTPGHTALRLSSGGAQFLILGDAIVSGALQFDHPDLHYALDEDPHMAAATRRGLFDMLAADGIPFAATHLEHPGAGRVTRHGDAYRFLPAA